MFYRFLAPAALLLTATLLSGCAGNGPLLGQGGLTTSAVPAADPACQTLAAQIDGLRREGVADKVEKAAAKKYKMTRTDLAKADELNKANATFKEKCSTLPPKAAAGPSGGPSQVAAAAPPPKVSPPPFPGDSSGE